MNNEKCENCGCPVHPCLPCEEAVTLYGNHTDEIYCNLLKDILKNGRVKKNRTGVNTIGVFGRQAKFDVRMDAFPILTTKKVHFKSIVHELLWFIKGDTNIKYLVDNGVSIWNEWAFARYQKLKPREGGILLPDPLLLTNQEKRVQKGEIERDDPVETVRANIARKQDEFIQLIKTDAVFAEKWGELGEGTYGGMWRGFPFWCIDDVFFTNHPEAATLSYDGKIKHLNYFYKEQEVTGTVDQLAKVIDKLKTNPDDRRMIVSAWHPYWVDHCALPPCHCLFHFNTEELTDLERCHIAKGMGHEVRWNVVHEINEREYDKLNIPRRRLNLLLYQRSCDTFLGVPFNITSYSLLLAMVAHCVGMEPGTFTHTYGDLHIYENHLDQVNLQLSRTPKKLPRLILAPKKYGEGDLFSYEYKDIILMDYESHPTIKAPIAV